MPSRSPEEKEALVQAILKGATVDKDKGVDFEFYVGDGPGYVVQNVKAGSPTLTSAQHRNGQTIKVRAENGAAAGHRIRV